MTEIASPKVTALHRLALRVPDLERAKAFYKDIWKLRAGGRQSHYTAFRTAKADHDELLLTLGERAVDHVAFEVASDTDLGVLTARLEAGGFPALPISGDPLSGDRAVAAFSDPDGRRVELVVAIRETPPVDLDSDPLAPLRMGHVVFWTQDQAAAERFYELLGFQVTDRTHIGMSFLRCNGDHHTIALVQSAKGKTGLQHIAFDVGSLDTVMKNYGRLRSLDVQCVWGVGRHGPGNNVFSYYADPAGNFVEYYGDMDIFPSSDLVEPRIWGPEHKGDIWGVAGIPPEDFRE